MISSTSCWWPGLLDVHAMSFYEWFARRAEAKEQVTYASGHDAGLSNPFFLATGRRAVMYSRIEDERPVLDIEPGSHGALNLLLTAKLGIDYQLESSENLGKWQAEKSLATGVPTNRPWETNLTVDITPTGRENQRFYRVAVEY